MTRRAASRAGITAATLLGVCAVPEALSQADTPPAPSNAAQDAPVRGPGTLDKPPHPLLAPLVPQLKSGFHKPASSGDGRVARLQPSSDPRDLAGRYAPGEATRLLPGEPGRLASHTDRGARTFLARAQLSIAGRAQDDPLAACKPAGAVRALSSGSAVQVLQSPTQVTTISLQDHMVRRIQLGARQGEAATAAMPSFVGTSIGRWEGNTLVVETRGLRADSWLDDYGDPASERTMLTERYTKQPNGSLRIEATINDPVNYSEPIRIVRNWHWAPELAWAESVCEPAPGHSPAKRP